MTLELFGDRPYIFAADVHIQQGGVEIVLADQLHAGSDIERGADGLGPDLVHQIADVIGEDWIILDNENAFTRQFVFHHGSMRSSADATRLVRLRTV